MSYKTDLQGNNTDLQTILSKVNGLPDALDTSDATASAGDIASGKTAYVNGEKVEGTMNGLTVIENVTLKANTVIGRVGAYGMTAQSLDYLSFVGITPNVGDRFYSGTWQAYYDGTYMFLFNLDKNYHDLMNGGTIIGKIYRGIPE